MVLANRPDVPVGQIAMVAATLIILQEYGMGVMRQLDDEMAPCFRLRVVRQIGHLYSGNEKVLIGRLIIQGWQRPQYFCGSRAIDDWIVSTDPSVAKDQHSPGEL